MLVYFHKGFTMEGEATFTEKKHFWSKPIDIPQKIYLHAGVDGICDESEVDKEIERLTAEQLKSKGWGKNFSGWQRVVPYEEVLEIATEKGWYTTNIPRGKVTIHSLDDWTVEKAAKELNGKQFAQYCRDYGIVIKDGQTYDL